jgi:hypothetical protein
MKFWELVSVCRSEPQVLQRLSENPAWADYLAWTADFDRLVDAQDRSKLDAVVPDDACRHVLAGSSKTYYLSDGYLRVTARDSADQILNSVDVFNTYGGGRLEEVQEAGLVKV